MRPSRQLLGGALMLAASLLLGCEDDASFEVGVARRPLPSQPTNSRQASGAVASSSPSDATVTLPSAPALPTVLGIDLSAPTLTLCPAPRFNERGDLMSAPGSVQLTATVRYDDHSKNDLVRWRSGDPTRVSVTESGMVRVLPPIGAPAPATVSIVASALLAPQITAECRVILVP